MSENIYAVPEADLETPTTETDALASRWRRFFAIMADGFLIMLILFPFMFFTIGWTEYLERASDPSIQFTVLTILSGLLIFLLLNTKMLITHGQTLGKRALKVKIVDMDGNKPTGIQLLKRYGFSMSIQYIPIAGGFLYIAEVMFGLGKSKRCGHDYIAGTKVIKCS